MSKKTIDELIDDFEDAVMRFSSEIDCGWKQSDFYAAEKRLEETKKALKDAINAKIKP